MRRRLLTGLLAVLLTGGIANAQSAEDGERAYEEHCSSCHGEKLRSTGAIPDLRDLRAEDRPRFDKQVLEGRGQMPAWQGVLTPGEIDQIWAYILANSG